MGVDVWLLRQKRLVSRLPVLFALPYSSECFAVPDLPDEHHPVSFLALARLRRSSISDDHLGADTRSRLAGSGRPDRFVFKRDAAASSTGMTYEQPWCCAIL